VVQLGFTADGATLAGLDWGGRVHLWDAAAVRPIPCDVPVAHCMAFAPKGSLLAFAADGVLFVDGSGKQLGTIPSERLVSSMAFSPDGRMLATFNRGPLALWDLSKGLACPTAVARQEMLRGPICMAFLPDGTLATGEDGGVVHFWKASGGKLVPARKPLKCRDRISDLVVLPDGKILLTNEPSYRPRFWDLQSLEWKVEWLFGARIFVSPDGQTMATCSNQGVVQLTDMRTWTTRLLADQPPWGVFGLAITPDGQELITVSDAPTPEVREKPSPGATKTESIHLQDLGVSLRCWGLADGRERPGLTGPLSMAIPSRMALSVDGHTLAAGSEDGSIYVWDRDSHRIQTRLFVSQRAKEYATAQELARSRGPASPDYPEEIRTLAFAADGSLLAAASSLGTVTVWEVASWQQVYSLQLESAGPFWAAFAPDGALVVPQGGRLRFLDPRNGKELRGLGQVEDSPALGVAFTARGDRLAVHHQHRLIRLWDVAEGTAVDLHGHLDEVSALAFTPDDRLLASASHDRTVKLWSVAAAAEVVSLEGHTGKIHCLVFSPDGNVLVSGGQDIDGRGEILLWRAPRP
jgi:WD40 repeat protein